MTEPMYEHDCDACVFLGTYNHKGKHDCDLYYCPNYKDPSIAGTVIARWSSDGPDYTSGNVFSWTEGHVLEEARLRTEAKGVTVPEY